jgi:adenylylsulfate reductase subunit B
MPPVIDKKLCDFCGFCYDVCPQDVFQFEKKRKEAPAVSYPQECWYCGACVVDCPKTAVSLTLPLPLHIVPSPALYGPPSPEETEALGQAAAFSRSIEQEPNSADARKGIPADRGKSATAGNDGSAAR